MTFMDAPLHKLKDWSPFRLDALGLVTLLGADEVSNALGALEHSRLTEYLPLFGIYLIAANKFTRPIPGFALYNISDGVFIPILNGWFSRWLIANLTAQVTILEWAVNPKKESIVGNEIAAAVIGFICNGILISMAALQADFYGLANAIAMALSVVARLALVHENRKHLSHKVTAYSESNFLNGKPTNRFLRPDNSNFVKVVITAPENKVVAFNIPRGLIGCIIDDLDVNDHYKTGFDKVNAPSLPSQQPQSSTPSHLSLHEDIKLGRLDKNQHSPLRQSLKSAPELTAPGTAEEGASHPSENLVQDTPVSKSKARFGQKLMEKLRAAIGPKASRHTWNYTLSRGLCWIFFAIHVVCIGQASLLNQMLSIAVLVFSTVLTIYRVGNKDTNFGGCLSIKKGPPGPDAVRHKDAYHYLDPSPEQERVMRSYLLLPYKPEDDKTLPMGEWNKDWWGKWSEGLHR